MTKQLSVEEEIETQIKEWSDKLEEFVDAYDNLCYEYVSDLYGSYPTIKDAYDSLPKEFKNSPRGKKLRKKIQEYEKEYEAIGTLPYPLYEVVRIP